MQSLSNKEYCEIKSVYESVYDSSRFETVIDGFTDEDLLNNFTEDYIEENVEELFIECMEEGMTIDEVEDILTESIESSIRLLSEDRYSSAVSTSKANSQKPEVKAANRREALRKVGSAVKKVASGLKKGAKAAGKAVEGGVGLAGRAVGTAQRAGERIKSAAKSGYERGRKGSGSSSGGSAKVTQGSGDSYSSSSSSSSPESSSSSRSSDSDSGSSSSAPAPKKRKDGLLKRGLKKLVRGISKGVSAAAGAVKAGADSLTDRARKEELEATGLFSEKEIEAIMEADSLAAMQARREKRLAAQRKREGTTVTGRDFGHDYSLTPAQQKARREAEFKAGIAKGRTKKEEVEQVDEDSRRMSNKQHTQRVRSNIKSFGSNYTPPSNYDPDANRGQGEVLTRKQIEKKRRKALRQEEVEYVDEDSRRMSNKQHTQRVRSNIKSFGSDYTPPSNYDPDANRGQGEVLTRKQIEKKRRKALRQEEVEQIDEISQKTATKAYARSVTGEYEGQDSPRDVRRSDTLRRNIKRKFGDKAAQHADRAAHAMTFGRNSKFMKMPKKPTNEEVEAVGEGLTGERYKEALKKGKQYSRRVSEDPAKRATRGGRGGESDFGAGDRGTGNRAARRAGTYEG